MPFFKIESGATVGRGVGFASDAFSGLGAGRRKRPAKPTQVDKQEVDMRDLQKRPRPSATSPSSRWRMLDRVAGRL